VCVGVGGGGGWGGFVDNAIFPAADSATALAARYSAAGFASKTRPFVAPYQLSVVHISEGRRSLALRQQRSASVPTNCRSLALTTGTTFVSLKNGQSGTKAGRQWSQCYRVPLAVGPQTRLLLLSIQQSSRSPSQRKRVRVSV